MVKDDVVVCPKCDRKLQTKADQFYWRGAYFSGLVCETCNALWNNPEDSFLDHVRANTPTAGTEGSDE